MMGKLQEVMCKLLNIQYILMETVEELTPLLDWAVTVFKVLNW